MELYKIVRIENGKVYTVYCDKECSEQEWDLDGFTSEGFGRKRVHVPDWVLDLKDNTPSSSSDDFEDAARPLVNWLCANKHPHHVVIVNNTGAELFEGTRSTTHIADYLKD